MNNLSGQTEWGGKRERKKERERERLLCWFFSFMTSLDTLSLLFVDGVSLRGKEAPSIRLFREMEWRPRRQKALEREWEKGYSSPLLFVERFANLLFPHRPTDRPTDQSIYDPTHRRWDTKVSKGKSHHRILQRINKILRLIPKWKLSVKCSHRWHLHNSFLLPYSSVKWNRIFFFLLKCWAHFCGMWAWHVEPSGIS